MSKRRNTETMRFGVSRHVTCVTHCKQWYSTTRTATRAQRTHSTSHPVHCNIVPCQATPSINPTYANSIRNLELKHMVTDCYVTLSQVRHQQPPSEDARTNVLNALTQGDGERRMDGVGGREMDK
jgi:hypothetical protein